MASRYPENPPHHTRKKVGPIDRISCKSDLVKTIPTSRLVTTVLLVTMCVSGGNAALYHCEIERQRRTFMYGLNNEEKEFIELRGETVTQALLALWGSAYVLTDAGELYSMGCNDYSQLGRSTQDVPATRFAKVDISDHVVSVTCGIGHCLAMTPTTVFAFGSNLFGQAGVPGGRKVSQPTEIYTGTGGQAPKQVAAGDNHSAILTEDGQVFTFGYGGLERIGHSTITHIYKPTKVKALTSKVQQIGCTRAATYFLFLDGVLLGCGRNWGSRLGVGHDKNVRVPTEIKTGGRKIQSFRCSLTLVVAITLSGEVLVWGACSDGTIIKVPELVQTLEFPRDVFARGEYRDTGGSVYPDKIQLWVKDLDCLTSQLTQLKQKMEHLVSQLTELKLKMLHVDDDESASKPTSARDPEHQAIQLLDHTILLAEHASLQATYKVIERKHMDLMKKFDMKQKNEESLQAEVEKLTWGYRSKQADFTSQQATLVDLQKEYTKLKADHHDLESQHRNLQSRVEDSKRTTISMPALMYVVENIGKFWTILSVHLEIPPAIRDNIETTCHTIPQRALAVLREWYLRKEEDATKEALIEALNGITRKDIADEIDEM